MAAAALSRALKIIESLNEDELQQVKRAVEERLQPPDDEAARREVFHRALLDSGLVTEIKGAAARSRVNPPLVPIQGEPLSETIIKERR